MADAIPIEFWWFGFALLMIVCYGFPIIGIIAGSIITKKAGGKGKKWGIALIAVSAAILIALVVNVIVGRIKYGF